MYLSDTKGGERVELKINDELDRIAIKLVNSLADEKVCIIQIDTIFDRVRQFIETGTPIKKIEN